MLFTNNNTVSPSANGQAVLVPGPPPNQWTVLGVVTIANNSGVATEVVLLDGQSPIVELTIPVSGVCVVPALFWLTQNVINVGSGPNTPVQFTAVYNVLPNPV